MKQSVKFTASIDKVIHLEQEKLRQEEKILQGEEPISKAEYDGNVSKQILPNLNFRIQVFKERYSYYQVCYEGLLFPMEISLSRNSQPCIMYISFLGECPGKSNNQIATREQFIHIPKDPLYRLANQKGEAKQKIVFLGFSGFSDFDTTIKVCFSGKSSELLHKELQERKLQREGSILSEQNDSVIPFKEFKDFSGFYIKSSKRLDPIPSQTLKKEEENLIITKHLKTFNLTKSKLFTMIQEKRTEEAKIRKKEIFLDKIESRQRLKLDKQSQLEENWNVIAKTSNEMLKVVAMRTFISVIAFFKWARLMQIQIHV